MVAGLALGTVILRPRSPNFGLRRLEVEGSCVAWGSLVAPKP